MRIVVKGLAVLLGITAFVAVGVWISLAPPAQHDEILFTGGEFITVAPQPGGNSEASANHPEALLVKDGRIVAVGTVAEVAAAASPNAHHVDLAGDTLMPGLIEPHTHPIAASTLGAALDVSGFKHASRAEVMETLRTAAGDWQPTGWIIAFGWDPVMIRDMEAPTLAELDAIAPDTPMVILTQMMHDAFANSAALKAAGIDANTPNPPGGEYVRDASGELTGTLRELGAITAMFKHVPKPPKGTAELLLSRKLADYARAGYTTLGVTGPVGTADEPLGLLARQYRDHSPPVQLSVYATPDQIAPDRIPDAATTPAGVIGVKFWMDGSPYAGGAALAEPYTDSPLTRERLHLPRGHTGNVNYGEDDFEALFAAYHQRGFQIAIHAQGERAIDRALDVAQRVLQKHPRADHRHRLEHNALITKEQLARAHQLGMTPSFFVDHITFYGHRLPDLVGEARTRRYMPLRNALEAGHRISLHTDTPATPIGPFRAFKAAVSRQARTGGAVLAPDQRLTRQEALSAMTIDAAWQLGLEAERGTLEIGKAADLVRLSANPLTANVDALDQITVRATWVAGQRTDTRTLTQTDISLTWQLVTNFF